MRKILVPAVAALAIALALPAASMAKSKHFAGTVSPSGTVSFNLVTKVKKKGKKRKKVRTISGFTFNAVPITCSDGSHTASGKVTFAAKFKGGFTIHAESSATGAKLDIRGSGTASGTLLLQGPVALDGAAQGSGCDTGTLSWTAARR